MSSDEPNTNWIILRDKLINLTSFDRSLQGKKPDEPAPLVAKLYTQYTKLIRQLDSCWSLSCQPQRNIALKRLLDAAIVRLSELRNMLTEIDISEYHYVDGALIEMKLIPRDMEVIPLESHPLKRSEQLQELARRLYNGERIYVEPDSDEEEAEDEVEEKEKEEKKPRFQRPVVEVVIDPRYEAIKYAVRIIQKHERARQGRLEFFDEKTMFDIRKTYFEPKPVPQEISEPAALKIQSLWRGYCVRRERKEHEKKVRLLIKMDIPSYRSKEVLEKYKEQRLKMKQKREEKIREYEEALVKEKTRVLKIIGPGLMEDIGDEIRLWFRDWYDIAKAFDKYPPEEKGGTIIVVRGETFTPEEYRIEQERIRIEKEKLKNNPELAKKMAAEAAKKKKEAEEKAKKEKEKLKREKKLAKKKKKEPEEFHFKESNALKQAQEANEKMEKEWTMKDEERAKNDTILMDKITEEKCCEMQYEVRKAVDEMMRLELEMLEDAMARDRAKKKGKKGKKDKKKKKKGKKKGGKKGKGKKDPTAHRTVEDLFQELYDNQIIHKYPPTTFDDYFGDYAYSSMELREQVLDPLPAIGDLRQVVMNTCILPLGGENIEKPKSICFIGPKDSGKHVLVNAICTETDAVLFDLSPHILAGKYPKKADMKMLIHLINKMSRILQPSVLFVDGAEKTFYKKVPKPERSLEPKKLKKQLFKGIVKTIKPEDRVMLIGISAQPWAATPRPFTKAYEKFILIPRLDYGSCYLLWMDILMKYHGVNRNIDVSALAKATQGYPIPYIREIASQVLCPKRLVRLKFEPLRMHELLEGLVQGEMQDPVTPQEQDKFTTWYNKKTKLGKRRTKIVQEALQKRLEQQALEDKKKKK